MPDQVQRGSFRRGWRAVGWALAVFLLAGLVTAGLLFYLRTAGLPDFAKNRLETQLRSRGWAVRFGRVRWTGPGTFLAENIVASPLLPLMGTGFIQRAELRLSRTAKLRFRLESISVDGGQVIWALPGLTTTSGELSLDHISGCVRFLPDGGLDLPQFNARLRNAQIRLSGVISHATAMRTWHFAGRVPRAPGDWQGKLDESLTALAKLDLAEHSELKLQFQGDGREPSSLRIDLALHAPGAAWPSGWLQNLRLTASTSPDSAPPGQVALRGQLCLDQAVTDWGQWRDLNVTSQGVGSLTNLVPARLDWDAHLSGVESHSVIGRDVVVSGHTAPVDSTPETLRTELALRSAALETPWGASASNDLSVTVVHGLTPTDPWEGQIRFGAGPVQSHWGKTTGLRFAGRLSPRSKLDPVLHQDESTLGFWARLLPYQVDWEWDLQDIHSPNLEATNLSCAGRWRVPRLAVENLHASLYHGQLDASGQLSVISRELQAKASLDFDVHRVTPLLAKASQRWLAQFSWQTPPRAVADGRVILPLWTNPHPNWREEVLPTLELAGEFAGSEGAFRGVPVAYASSHFTLTNLVWHLPDLVVRRPDADATLDYTGDMRTHEYQWRVDARANPKLFKSLLDSEPARRALDQFEFKQPLSAQGEVWGRWHEPASVGFNGRVAATNFLFRGEECDLLTGSVRLGNANLSFANVVVRRGAEQISVPEGRFDLTERVVYLTNAIGTMDPDIVTKVIGPRVRAAIQPYRFGRPPTVRVNGRLPTFDTADADVRFEVAGESFSYWKLHVPSITGDIHWRGDALSLTNVQASFYGGELAWRGDFDFSVPVGANLRFEGKFQHADLHRLMADLGRKTNRLEGSLDGQVVITSANSDDWRSWQGSGKLRLRDGFLWDIPIFGIFSPVLNKVVPGLGNSPISSGQASFKIDQSVVETKDLELKSPALRLRYIGAVDFKGKVDARMRAEILRDTWGIGRVVSLALWPISKVFEYQMTGTVYHPKTEPVYLPKAVTWAFHPFRAVKKLFIHPKEKAAPSTPENPFFTPTP